MLKRAIAAIRKGFFRRPHDSAVPKGNAVMTAGRRRFFAKATFGAMSITGTAGLAQIAIDSVPKPDLEDLYAKDAANGEQELMEREYVLMSEREVEDMVQTFTRNHANNN